MSILSSKSTPLGVLGLHFGMEKFSKPVPGGNPKKGASMGRRGGEEKGAKREVKMSSFSILFLSFFGVAFSTTFLMDFL